MSKQQEKAALSTHERVTGIGGVFFKAKDLAKLIAWYNTHLVIKPESPESTSSIFQ